MNKKFAHRNLLKLIPIYFLFALLFYNLIECKNDSASNKRLVHDNNIDDFGNEREIPKLPVFHNIDTERDHEELIEKMKEDVINELKMNPNSAGAHYDYAVILLSEGDVDHAIEELEISLSLNPDNPLIYMSIAEAFRIRVNEDQKRRIKYLRKAFSFDSNNPLICEQLGKYYKNMGDNKNAKRFFNLAKEILLSLPAEQKYYIDKFNNSYSFGKGGRDKWLKDLERELDSL